MYLDHRKSGGGPPGANNKSSPATSERSSPSGALRESLASGALSGFSERTSGGSGKYSSGRLSSGARHAAAGKPVSGPGSVQSISSDKQAAGSKPGLRGSDIKSYSFHGLTSGSSLFQALRTPAGASSASQDSQSRKPRTSLPADLGSTLGRRAAISSFKPVAALSATMPAATSSSRPKTNNMPTETCVVLDDVTFTFGHSSFQGQRDYQEDAVSVLTTPTALLGGVFDGHGGDQVSKELERILLQNINRKVCEAQLKNPDDYRAVETAIRQAYVSTNEDIANRMDKAQEAGSCAVTTLVKRVGGRMYLFCANAGDCRAVLCSQGIGGGRRAIRLSEDHKPHPNVCPSEITRVCDAGGCVLWGRVQGCLAVSRAFGDCTLQPYVIADPHVDVRPLDPERDMFMYLASDGVTDMVDDLQGCTLIAEQLAKGSNTAQAAAALVSCAYHKGSGDNISVLVVRIRRRQHGDPLPSATNTSF